MSINPDATVFVMTGFFAVLTAVLFGTLPAWRAGPADCEARAASFSFHHR